jgi:Protein of unknown function (DUF3309)
VKYCQVPMELSKASGRIAARGEIVIRTVLLILLVLLLLGSLPAWPYSTGWGYYPSGGLGLLLLILIILIVMGRI